MNPMHSILFHIGPIPIRAYGLCMAVGFLCSWQLALYLCKKTKQTLPDLTSLLTWIMFSAVLGARLAYVIEHWQAEFAHNPLAIVRIDQGGLMFYGGLIAAFIPLLAYTWFFKVPFFVIGDLAASVIALGHAFGRLGCFMHGCCFGKLSTCACAVSFPQGSPAWYEQVNAGLISATAPSSLPVLPSQLVESGGNLVVFLILFFLYPSQHHKRGFISGLYLILYAILRFNVEYLRGDPRYAVGPLSISQTISIGMVLLGLTFILLAQIKHPKATP